MMGGTGVMRQTLGLALLALLLAGCAAQTAKVTGSFEVWVTSLSKPAYAFSVKLVRTEATDNEIMDFLSGRGEKPDWDSWSQQTDAKGEFGFDDVVPGRYRLWIKPLSLGHWSCRSSSLESELMMVEVYDMESRSVESNDGFTTPFEVRAGERIRIEIQCKKEFH